MAIQPGKNGNKKISPSDDQSRELDLQPTKKLQEKEGIENFVKLAKEGRYWRRK